MSYSSVSVCPSVTSRLATFAICYRPSVCRLSVVCRSVTFVRSAQPVGIFSTLVLGHPLTSTENFTEIVPGEPLRRGGLNARGVPNIAILDLSKATSRKRCDIGCKLLLITNRKSYMSFRLVPKSVTLNDLERHNGPYFALFHRIG